MNEWMNCIGVSLTWQRLDARGMLSPIAPRRTLHRRGRLFPRSLRRRQPAMLLQARLCTWAKAWLRECFYTREASVWANVSASFAFLQLHAVGPKVVPLMVTGENSQFLGAVELLGLWRPFSARYVNGTTFTSLRVWDSVVNYCFRYCMWDPVLRDVSSYRKFTTGWGEKSERRHSVG